MQDKILHIISFDYPFPPRYGGVIEVFYKIKALHELGYQIHLHCFVTEMPSGDSVLNQYVTEVYYYKNRKSLGAFFSSVPFSVACRNAKELAANLEKVHAPILFESLKTTSLINRFRFSQRCILRLHNVEHQYFLGIAKSESNLLLKLLYYVESWKYRKYEAILDKFDTISTLSVYETAYVSERFKKAAYVSLFHGNEKVKELSGFGDYAIYNGDLRTADNRRCVRFLIDVFKEIKDYRLVIATSERQQWVEALIKGCDNITFVKVINYEHLKELLSNAHINVMMSFQESGTKLKIINGLFNSRHCLINTNMVDDARIQELCNLAATKSDFISQIGVLRAQPFTDYTKRKAILDEVLNDKKNALSLVEIINNASKQ